ncbi:protein aspartic protease in guard cell 2 [Phtheirospermum japonicum]|uniref:Protein aspartic protease in guard cell 2 n=1 Tax=Phtheirospermum japonicum TaxID=374723 RepID=A0A830CMR9_9LAMI|nr:protein aspartic protease in guard cell 2 [Phtheirospermum japonicum]
MREWPSAIPPTKFKAKNLNETKSTETIKPLTLPVQSGKIFGTDKYTVTFRLGSPYQELSLPFNTISNLIWTRCNPDIPAVRQDLYFKPSASSTYFNITCNSPLCINFVPQLKYCTSNTSMCIYSSKYDDQSFSDGIFSLDRLNMTDEFSDFLFFCVPYDPRRFSVSPNAGLLGLGRGDLSLASQLGLIYNNYFSYCLPSNSNSTGHLTFGINNSANNNNNNVKFTRLFASKNYPSFYFIRIVSIAVGGGDLSIDYQSPVFQDPGIKIDSGTFITRLPAEAYAPMRDAFREQMKDSPMAPTHDIFDTCYYNTTNQPIKVTIPVVSFTFDGDVRVEFDASAIFHAVDPTVMCFSFANNTRPPSLSVFGNAQQKKMEVVYDVANEKLGFRPNGCD